MKGKLQLKGWLTFLVLAFLSQQSEAAFASGDNTNIVFYSTKADQSELLQKHHITLSRELPKNLPVISVKKQVFQTMDGFGYTLTGGSAELLNAMSPNARQKLLNELFGMEGTGIGISYLRLSIGASDLSSTVFSYNDLPQGDTDLSLANFSLSEDKKQVIPILKEILAINGDIKLMASPWSPPTWMKSNGSSKGGKLKVEYYDVYANYFVRYIKEMAAEGIDIDAVTIQNEPLHPGNNPSLHMTAIEQTNFIKKSLGPIFKQAGISSKIIIYDHNADRIDYPLSILNDPDANQYIDGSAFHLYGGEIEALSEVHAQHPDKNIYFTEQWIGSPTNFSADMAWHMKNILIGAPRNWSRTVLEWNLAADPELNPHTPGGCDRCLGAITLDGDVVSRNPAFYIIAHASKHVRPGSKRLASNNINQLPNVAFKAPNGEIVVIVFNDDKTKSDFVIEVQSMVLKASLDAGSAGTFVFPSLKSN